MAEDFQLHQVRVRKRHPACLALPPYHHALMWGEDCLFCSEGVDLDDGRGDTISVAQARHGARTNGAPLQ